MAIVVTLACLTHHWPQQAQGARRKTQDWRSAAAAGTPYLSASSPRNHRNGLTSAVSTVPAVGRKNSISQSPSHNWARLGENASSFVPRISSAGYLLHNLPAIAGLPRPFSVTRCSQRQGSQAWVDFAQRLHDRLKMGDPSR